MALDDVAKLATALCEVPVPKSGSISTNPIAKAIGEQMPSHYLVPPRAECDASFATPSLPQNIDLPPTCLNTTSSAYLCIHFGSPDSTDLFDVYKFLVEIFDGVAPQPLSLNRYSRSDERKISKNWSPFSLVQKALSRLLYAPISLFYTRKRYQAVFTSSGFPLKKHSIQLIANLNSALPQNQNLGRVYLAMQHGSPSIEEVCHHLNDLLYQKIIVIPLYPQNIPTMTERVCARVQKSLSTTNRKATYIKEFHLQDWYIDALTLSLKEHSAEYDALLFSYHSVPEKESLVYRLQCEETTERIMTKSGIAMRWKIGYQSKMGRGKWLGKESCQVVTELAKTGVKSLLVIAPGFITPCTETLIDIEHDLKNLFFKLGGSRFELLPPICTSRIFIHDFSSFLDTR